MQSTAPAQQWEKKKNKKNNSHQSDCNRFKAKPVFLGSHLSPVYFDWPVSLYPSTRIGRTYLRHLLRLLPGDQLSPVCCLQALAPIVFLHFKMTLNVPKGEMRIILEVTAFHRL